MADDETVEAAAPATAAAPAPGTFSSSLFWPIMYDN